MMTFLMLTSLAFAGVDTTPTGIPLDTEWKVQAYAFAVKNVVHPSWGISHSERNYQLTKKLALAEGVPLDLDVLFVASFFHDLGGLTGFEKEGVDHAVRSVELVEPLVKSWGFPMEKWSDVKDMILGHTYYGPAPTKPQSVAFRDADILDFLGAIGISRIMAITTEAGRASPVLKPLVDTLRSFQTKFLDKLGLNASRVEVQPKLKHMRDYFEELDRESLNGKAL